jgi:hypothetical protein
VTERIFRSQRLAQQLTGRTDERLAREVFLIAGLLADQHHARIRRTLAEHGLGAALPQVAPAASRGCLPERVEAACSCHVRTLAAARSQPTSGDPCTG